MLVHPLTGLVAVTVYVPAAFTVVGLGAFISAPPFHASVFPTLVAVKLAIPVEQLITPELLAEAITGRVVLLVMTIVAVEVQPLPASVAVTVYVPVALTVAGLAELLSAPPFQSILLPTLVPVSVMLATKQVNSGKLADAVTEGAVVLLPTVTVC